VNNLPKVVAQQRRGRASNPRLLDRKSDALPLRHRATHTVYCIVTCNYLLDLKPLRRRPRAPAALVANGISLFHSVVCKTRRLMNS